MIKGGEPGRNLVVEAVDPTTRSKGLLILYRCRYKIPIYEGAPCQRLPICLAVSTAQKGNSKLCVVMERAS